MTTQEILELARLIGLAIDPPWWPFIASIISAGVVACSAAYLKKKAENFATSEDFEKLRDQLKKTTQDAEEIKQILAGKGWLAQQRWAKREQQYAKLFLTFQSLRRVVLALLRSEEKDPSKDKELWKEFEKALFEMDTELLIARVFITSEAFEKQVVKITEVPSARVPMREMLNHIGETCLIINDVLLELAREDLRKIEGEFKSNEI